MYLIKAVISPLFLIISGVITGIILLIIKKKEKAGKLVLIIAFISLCVLSVRPFSNLLIWGLETRYPPISDLKKIKDIDYIVVLTDWDSNNPTVPYTSNLGYRSAFRVLETHRIYLLIPEAKIIISGRDVSTQLMKKIMELLGVPEEKIIIDNHSNNTWESAENINMSLSGQKFILVTSAIHLPRAMKCFTLHGLDPIPAPADFMYGYYRQFEMPIGRSFDYYLPNIEALMGSSSAIYEYLGIWWYYIKAKV